MKLKQIAIEPGRGDQPSMLWGLCGNGTLWMRMLVDGSKWLRVAGPPKQPATIERARLAVSKVKVPVLGVKEVEVALTDDAPEAMRVSGGAAE